MDSSVPVVVVYKGGIGALSVARSLGRLGIPVYLISQLGASPVSASRYWRRTFWCDFSRTHDEILGCMLDVAAAVGSRPILLTMADWVATFIEDHAADLSEHYTLFANRPPIVHMLSNKWLMFQAAKAHGIPTPHAVFPASRQAVLEFASTARFPIMLKGADQSLPHGRLKEVVGDPNRLLERFDDLLARGTANVILQEYIPGNAESVWMCLAYFGAGSTCRGIFTGQKLRQLSSTGIASIAICRSNEMVEQQTLAFMQGIGYSGCVGIGYRFDARDGQYKVLDVNPRVDGAFRLFRTANGMDIVRACYFDLTRQPIPPMVAPIGRKWMLEDDFFTAASELRRGNLTIGKWLRSLFGVRELQWFAWDDPVPFLAWLRVQLRWMASSFKRHLLGAKVPTDSPAGSSAKERAAVR
jgi:D-aspartate ligase